MIFKLKKKEKKEKLADEHRMELLELVLGDVDEYLDDSNATEDATLVHVHVEEQFDILRSDDGLCKRQNGLVWRRR